MAYRYGIKNVYRPSQLISNAYGWSGAPQYNRADIPTALMDAPAGLSQEQFLQQFAYEWYQSGSTSVGMSNPPFIGGAAGRLHPALTEALGGGPSRILRGFIRRAQFDAGDNVSRARLYFMYNPEIISRDYVSYLEQGALDPFNTVYQSGNLVAPPSILDFSFELFFDRQEEAAHLNHPGVFVDYQFFDLVVRNVVPSDPNQASNALPDSGVMMVNPRDITVIFSPQFTVQGRPINARVTFEKFTHRMTPTRMRIALTLRAVYIGPVKDMTEYRAETFAAEAAIPFGTTLDKGFIVTHDDAVNQADANEDGSDSNNQSDLDSGTNEGLRLAALKWAKDHTSEDTVYVDGNSGSARWNLPVSADCSGLVVEAYRQVNKAAAEKIFGTGHPGTEVINNLWKSNQFKYVLKVGLDGMKPGDLIWKPGHIMFFESYAAGGKVNVVDAASPSAGVGERTTTIQMPTQYVGRRPVPFGADGSANSTNNPDSSTV